MSAKNASKEVILCRGTVDNNDTRDEYINTFQSAGFSCRQLTVLKFEFSNLSRLKECLLSPNLYGGLIITSRRSVEAINFALQGVSLPKTWNDLPVYCVGPATMSLVESSLKLKNCLGSDCGNSKDLAAYITKEITSEARPLLYPCSAIARETIEGVLGNNLIKVEKIVAYDTLPSETLEYDLKQIIQESQIFVFFSPSTVEFTLNIARKLTILDKIQAVAIGPATADALVKAQMVVHAISGKPEPGALLTAIRAAQL